MDDRTSESLESSFKFDTMQKSKTVIVTTDPHHTLITPIINEDANESEESSLSSDTE